MKKFYAIALALILAALFAYHFYAANAAEDNIDASIQEITAKLIPPLSVSYSSVEVSPFSGDIHFSDLNIIRNRDIRRARSVQFDFSYFDFLNLTLFGTEYGLKRIHGGTIFVGGLSFTNRSTLSEIKVDTLVADYRGELWKLLRLRFTDTTGTAEHNLMAEGLDVTLSLPNDIGILKADSLRLHTDFLSSQSDESLSGNFALQKLTWNPTENFKNQYRFFIQGFGYRQDSIPFRDARLEFDYASDSNLLSIPDMKLRSELFTGALTAEIHIDSVSFSASTIKKGSLRFSDLAPRLQNVLTNAEKLFGIKIPMADSAVSMNITGTFSEPEIRMTNQ